MLRLVAPLLAAAAASAWTNLGPCGANGRWGETVEEKIFFLKTIKTAGSTTRFIFLRFARGERIRWTTTRVVGSVKAATFSMASST